MYNELFELEQMPFANTADSAFFFKTAEHEEALAALFYGVTQRRGVVVISGPSGSGKTLLAHMLVEQLRPEAQVALLLHTPENGHELVASLCRELGVRHRSTQPTGELVERLRQFLVERFLEGKSVVAVVDEAQNMNIETMEHLRMLGNIEKENAKLLQIVLLGQPELIDKLSLPQMQQVCQRIFCHRQLGPLAHDQTRAYIRHRLKVAGAKDETVFSDEAIDLIHDRSGGLPRLINQIADNAMLSAYAIGQKIIDRELVFNCAKDMLGLNIVEPAPQIAVAPTPAAQPGPVAAGPPVNWPSVAYMPPAVTAAAGELDDAVRHGAEIAGRLSEINRAAQNHSGELKSLLSRAETITARMSETNQASTAGNIELIARLKEVNSAIRDADRFADQLNAGRSNAAQLTDRLGAIVKQAESLAQTLEAAGPEATRNLDEVVRRAQAAAADVAQAFTNLNSTASAATDLREQMLGVLTEAKVTRESLQQVNTVLGSRSADARKLLESLEQTGRKLEAPLSQTQVQSDRLAGQLTQANAAAEKLDQQSKNLPSLLNACDASLTEMRTLQEQIPAGIQLLREASEQARNDLTRLQATAQIVSAQSAQADTTCKACVQENETLQSSLRQARVLDQQLSTRQDALPSLLNACDESLAEMRDWQKEIPNHIRQLASASEQARKDLATLEAAIEAVSAGTVEATTATQAFSKESKALQSILPQVQELNRQLSTCQQELPALLQSCDTTLADMRDWQDEIPNQIEQLTTTSRQAREELTALQAAAQAASAQTARAIDATRSCVKETESLQSILPRAQEINRQLLDQQDTLPALLEACEDTLAELQQRERDIPGRIQQLAEAGERARSDLLTLQAAGQTLSAQAAQAEATTKACSKENETLQSIIPQARELNQQLSARQETLPSLLNACDETLAEIQQRQEEIPSQVQQLTEARRRARDELASLQDAAKSISAQAAQADATSKACSRENETLQSILPVARELNQQLSARQETLPSLLNACDETLAEMQQQQSEIPSQIQQLMEAGQQVRNDLAAVEDVAKTVSAQTTQAEVMGNACAKESETIQSILPQARELNQQLSARQQALPSLLNACDEALVKMQQQQGGIPDQIRQLIEAGEQARNEVTTLQAAARAASAQTSQAEVMTQACAKEIEDLQSMLPQAREINQQLSDRQEALPSLLNACDETIAEIRHRQETLPPILDACDQTLAALQHQQAEIPGRIQSLLEVNEQACTHLTRLQAAVQTASELTAQADTTTKACAKETETLQSVLPQARELNRQLSIRQEAMPPLLTECDEKLAEMRGLKSEIPGRIQQLSEADERARNDLAALHAAAQTVANHTAQADTTVKVCAKESDTLQSILPQARVLNQELSSRQDALPSLLNACEETLAEMQRRQGQIPNQIEELAKASQQARHDLTTLEAIAQTVSAQTTLADATTKTCAAEHEKLQAILPQVVGLNQQLSACQDVLPSLLSTCDETLSEMREWQDEIPNRIQALSEASEQARVELSTLQAATRSASAQTAQTDATTQACAQENETLTSVLPEARKLSQQMVDQQHALPALLNACNEALVNMRGWQDEIPGRIRQLTEASERARDDLASLLATTQAAAAQTAQTDATIKSCVKENESLQSILPHARELNQELSARQEAVPILLNSCNEKLAEIRDWQSEIPGRIQQLANASEQARNELAALQSATETASAQTTQSEAATKESARHHDSLQSLLPRVQELSRKLTDQQTVLPALLDACEETLAEMQHRQDVIPTQIQELADTSERARNELTALQTAAQTVLEQAARTDATTEACAKAKEALESLLPQAYGLNEQLAARQEALPPLLNACDEHARQLTGRLSEIPVHLQQIDEHCERLGAVGQTLEAATDAATDKAVEVENVLATCTDRIDDLGRILVQASSLAERLDEVKQTAASTSETCELQMAELTGRLEHIPTQIAALGTACERADNLHKSLDTDTRTAQTQIDESRDLSRRVESQSQTMEVQLRAIQSTGAELNQIHAALKQAFSEEAVNSIKETDAKVRASLAGANSLQLELTSSTRSAEAVRNEITQSCDVAKEWYQKLASAEEQVETKTARAATATEACVRRADELTWLLTESDRAADNLADQCTEAGLLNDEWTQRIATLAEENRHAFMNSQQLDRASHQAEEIQNLLTRRAIAAIRQITTVQDQAARQTEETERATEQARHVLADLISVENTLEETFGDEFLDGVESRRLQLVSNLENAARRQEELSAAGATAEALRQQLIGTCETLDQRLAESAGQSQQIHHDLINAIAAANSQTTIVTELCERMNVQTDTLGTQINAARSAGTNLEQLRAEVTSTTIPQAVATLLEQRKETESTIAEATHRAADLKAATEDAQRADTQLAATVREAGDVRIALDDTSGEVRLRLAELRDGLESTSRTIDAHIGQLGERADNLIRSADEQLLRRNGEIDARITQLDDHVATVIRSAGEQISHHRDELDTRIAQLGEQAGTITRAAGEQLSRRKAEIDARITEFDKYVDTVVRSADAQISIQREDIDSRITQLGEQAETVARITSDQISRIRDEAAQVTDRIEEQIKITGSLSSKVDDLTDGLNIRVTQAEKTILDIGERADQTVRVLAGEADHAKTLLAQLSRVQAEINQSLSSERLRDIEKQHADLRVAIEDASSKTSVLTRASSDAQTRTTRLVESNQQAVNTIDSLQASASSAASICEKLDEAAATAAEQTRKAEALLSRMFDQISQLTNRIESAEQNSQRLESLQQTLDRIVSPGLARTLEEKSTLLESLLTQATERSAAIESAAAVAERNAAAAGKNAQHANEINELLSGTLEAARKETGRLDKIRARAEERLSPLQAAAQAAEQKSESLRKMTEKAEQIRNDYGQKLEALVGRIDQAAQHSKQIEGLLQNAPQFQTEMAEQAKMATELKRELDRTIRKLANERRMAEAAMEQLHDLRIEQLTLAKGAETVGTTSTQSDSGQQEGTVARRAHVAFDALNSLRQAVAGHEPCTNRQPGNRLDAARDDAVACRG